MDSNLKKTVVIGIAGCDCVGKSLVARMIQKHIPNSKIFEIGEIISNAAKHIGWNGTKDNSKFGRSFLIDIGVFLKSKFGKDFFINLAIEKCKDSSVIIIPSVRSVEESLFIMHGLEDYNKYIGFVIYVNRDGFSWDTMEESEIRNDIKRLYETKSYTHLINNNGTIEELESECQNILNQL